MYKVGNTDNKKIDSSTHSMFSLYMKKYSIIRYAQGIGKGPRRVWEAGPPGRWASR